MLTFREELSFDGLRLTHESPTIFVKSQWQKNPNRSKYYLVYRCVLTVYLIITIFYTIFDEDQHREKYFIFLTNWGYMLIFLQSSLCTAMLSVWYFTAKKDETVQEKDNKAVVLYPIYWSTNTIAMDLCLVISTVYWSLLFKGTIQTPADPIVHLGNSLVMLIELIVVAHPVRLLHFYVSLVFGLCYVFFNYVYYICGGTNKTGGVAIYSILNWEKEPTLSVFVCCAIAVFIIAIHILIYGIYRLRIWLYGKFLS